MIQYKINQYFNQEECNEIIEFCLKNGDQFSYNPNDNWDCKRIYNEEFKSKILKSILDVQSFDSFNIRNINVSFTQYYDGRRLDLHLDKTSNYTTVIPLTTNYKDGRFVLSNFDTELENGKIKLDLKMGEGVTFEGNKIFHGVMPVNIGIRQSLNIWMNDTNFIYHKLDDTKKLI